MSSEDSDVPPNKPPQTDRRGCVNEPVDLKLLSLECEFAVLTCRPSTMSSEETSNESVLTNPGQN